MAYFLDSKDIERVENHASCLSFVAVVARTEDEFFKTVEFYKALGFQELYVFDRSNPEHRREEGVGNSSERETWMTRESPAQWGPNMTIKIRFVSEAIHWKQTAAARRTSIYQPGTGAEAQKDWRGTQEHFVFYCKDLNTVVDTLVKLGVEYQLQPNPHHPCEVYAHDPVNTLIGFTTKSNPCSTQKSKYFDREKMPKIFSEPVLPSDQPVKQKIAVMTSGGDAPGMNAAVRAVVRMAIAMKCDAFVIKEGYEGLLRGGDMIEQFGWEDVRGWLSEGGTLIGTARCKGFRERKGRLQAALNLVNRGINALIVIGGDGSLTGADLFRSEWPGLIAELVETGRLAKDVADKYRELNICGMVGSIDNDMSMTDATIGCYSSLTRICQAVDFIDSTASSHQRAFIVEVMGRHCGWLALMSGLSTGADFIFIPEKPPGEDWKEQMCETVRKHRASGKRQTIIIVAEGAIDVNLKPITANAIKDALVDSLDIDTRVTTLGHIQRGGPPCAYDRYLATIQGADAVKAVLSANKDTPSPMIAITENKLNRRPLMDAVAATKEVAVALEKKDFHKAMLLRDAEFEEYYDAYVATTLGAGSKGGMVAESKRKKIAIIHIGAPAGGMNAATRAAAAYCLGRGHRPFAIKNGFTGLTRHNAVQELTWQDIDGWSIRGGSEIGTNRNTPDCDLGMVAYFFQEHAFEGLLIVGGFEAFASLSILKKERKNYPAFRIPMVLIPATISNNVPGTDFSIGSDTCLNALIDYCDAIKQSASATRRRVFVVEVQGGNSGYIATLGGLSVGAIAVYTPEEGMSLGKLDRDIKLLRQSFANDKGMNRAGKLILKNEKASKTFTTDIIASIIQEEAGDRFQSRTAVPGHVQQGGTPSPIDRVRAVRLAVRAIKYIEEASESFVDDPELDDSAVVVGITGASLKFTSISHLGDAETEWDKRRPKKSFWTGVGEIADILANPPADLANDPNYIATYRVDRAEKPRRTDTYNGQ